MYRPREMVRPRNVTAVRGSTGRIKTATYDRDFDNAELRWARLRDTLRQFSSSPRLTDELGRLHFMGVISSAHYEAGRSFGFMLETYDRRVLGVKRSVSAHGFERHASADEPDDWEQEKLLAFKERFERLDAGLKADCGRACREAVAELCRGNHAKLVLAAPGLEWLVKHFRINPDLVGEPQVKARKPRKSKAVLPSESEPN